MKLNKLLTGKSKNILIGLLLLASFFILLPNIIKVIKWQMAPYTENEIVITNVSYESEVDGEECLIVGNLFQPSPKFSDKEYPAIIACHGHLMGIGKESMHGWCVELVKRDFIVLAIDLPGHGMSIGEMDALPRKDIEPEIIEDGIDFLKDYDFVDSSNIGLIGLSYGGATVSISAGVLGDLVDATISLNGFTNFTNWLIEGILPDSDVDFTVKKDYIEIEKVGDREVSSRNIKDILKFYGIFRGDEENMEDLIISGTRRLDREFLKKFDAVEYFPNARDNSVMFIHSKHDKTFDKTNQSGQGYKSIINAGKKAYYILVDDNHQLSDDSEYTSYYCIINFFEEKLKNVDLGGDWDNDYEKYSQPRDIELTFAPVFSWSLFHECILYFSLSLIPFFIIISIIFYNKKIATKRAAQEEKILKKRKSDEDFIDFSFGRGSYYKTIVFIVLSYIVAFTAIIGLSLGFFSELIALALCTAFYLVLYLALYYLPDQAEVDLWEQIKEDKAPIKSDAKVQNLKGRFFKKWILLVITFSIIIISSIIGFFITQMPKYFKQPIEQIITPMLFLGSIFLISGILIIFFIERRNDHGKSFKKIDWQKYTLGKYQIIKSLTSGSVIFLNILFAWNILAFYMKFPMMIGPHSMYFLYAAIAVVLFFAGVQLFVKILNENIVKDKININKTGSRKKQILLKGLVELVGFLIGLSIIISVSFITFYSLLDSRLFGNLTFLLVFYLSIIYLITSLIRILSVDKCIFGISIFIPLTFFAVIAFFLHI